MATLSQIAVRITGNSASLVRSLDKAETRTGKFKKNQSELWERLKMRLWASA